MNALLFTLFFAVASAAVVRDDLLVLHQAEATFDDALAAVEMQLAEARASSKLGQYLKDALENLVGGIKDSVDKIKDVTEKVASKVEELGDKLRELEESVKSKSKEAVERVKQKVRNIVQAIKDNINKQVEVVAEQIDEASYLRVRDLVKVIREKISNKVQDIRQYIKETSNDSVVVRDLDELLDQLKDSELADILNNILDLGGHELRHLKDLYQQLKAIADRTDGVLKQKINDLLGYVKNVWKNGVEQLVNKYHNLKANLLEVVDKTKDFSVEAVKDALKNLEDYKHHLGDLYGKLVESLKKTIGKF